MPPALPLLGVSASVSEEEGSIPSPKADIEPEIPVEVEEEDAGLRGEPRELAMEEERG